MNYRSQDLFTFVNALPSLIYQRLKQSNSFLTYIYITNLKRKNVQDEIYCAQA